MVRTGVTFADAAAEWLRYIEHDRMRKPSTISTYRSLLGSRILPAFGSMPIESVTSEMIESWIASVDRTAATRVKLLAMVHGIFQRARKVWGLKVNPAVDVEKPPLSRSGDIEVFSPEEVWALVRAAASEQDAAIFERGAVLRGCRQARTGFESSSARRPTYDHRERTGGRPVGLIEGQFCRRPSGGGSWLHGRCAGPRRVGRRCGRCRPEVSAGRVAGLVARVRRAARVRAGRGRLRPHRSVAS
jgi:hypothetical protein